MSSDNKIVFYDIASKAPHRTFAPNPWKTRYALNLKKVHYQTKPIEMPDITSLREKLECPANRTLPNGKPFYTLPVIQDPSTGQIIGDTFEIALYLDKTYPSEAPLFRPGTVGLTAALNQQVDGLFTKYVQVNEEMPFDEQIGEKVKDIFAARFGLPKEVLEVTDEIREQTLVGFENALAELYKAYQHTGGTTDWFFREKGTATEQAQTQGKGEVGFLDGDEPVYADLIVGGWLASMEAAMRPESWARLRTWQGGFWGRLHDELEYLRDMK